jgi:L-ascorbate metabolism protein UlaG (beta-lactamase superfamily)
MRLAEQDIDWHDGNLVDVHVAGLPGKKQTVRLFLDLYPDEEGADRRKRYLCTGEGLTRILFSGDTGRIHKHSKSGNIDFMRVESGSDTEILTVTLFGGVVEAEAQSFHLTEALK